MVTAPVSKTGWLLPSQVRILLSAFMNIVDTVLKSKKYRHLDRKSVEKIVKKYAKKKEYAPRTKEFKQLLKQVKHELHVIYGRYMPDYNKIEKLLTKLPEKSLSTHIKLLSLHESTRDRIPYYKRFYKEIFNITGKPKKLADLACGLNPLSYPFLGAKPYYYALEFNKKDTSIIRKYFKIMKIKGEAHTANILNLKKDFKDYDVVFLFKILSVLGIQEKGYWRKLLEKIKAKHIVISLSTKSLTAGKALKSTFEKRLKYKKKISFPEEDIYVI